MKVGLLTLTLLFGVASCQTNTEFALKCHAGSGIFKAYVDTSARAVILDMDGRTLTFSPVSIREGVVEYAETGPGSDDERYVTYRSLRLDLESGRLNYFRHQPEFEHIAANCQ